MDSRVRRTCDSGFTLAELMVVVVILGILILIAVGTFAYSTRAAARVTCEHNRTSFQTAVAVYRNDKDAAPASLEDLRPYVSNFAAARVCPADKDTVLRYDPATDEIICDYHQ